MCIEPRARDASSIRAEAAPPAPRLPLRARRATASALSPARDSPPRLRPAPNGPHGPLRPDPPSRGRWGRFARVAARHDRRLRARRVCSAHARGRRHAQPPTTHARNARAARPEPGGYRLTLTGKLSVKEIIYNRLRRAAGSPRNSAPLPCHGSTPSHAWEHPSHVMGAGKCRIPNLFS